MKQFVLKRDVWFVLVCVHACVHWPNCFHICSGLNIQAFAPAELDSCNLCHAGGPIHSWFLLNNMKLFWKRLRESKHRFLIHTVSAGHWLVHRVQKFLPVWLLLLCGVLFFFCFVPFVRFTEKTVVDVRQSQCSPSERNAPVCSQHSLETYLKENLAKIFVLGTTADFGVSLFPSAALILSVRTRKCKFAGILFFFCS